MPAFNKNINKYKVKVGTSLEFWESKNWINKTHPYGWVHWYCDFYLGKRGPDDDRQILRWKKIAGQNGRFTRFLVTQILKKNKKYDDESISPKIRQVLQHWGYYLKMYIFYDNFLGFYLRHLKILDANKFHRNYPFQTFL